MYSIYSGGWRRAGHLKGGHAGRPYGSDGMQEKGRTAMRPYIGWAVVPFVGA